MTSMQSNQTGESRVVLDLSDTANAVGADASSAAQPMDTHEAHFGSHLRAAREAHGLDVDECARELRLPTRVLQRLESGDYDGSDSRIYLASYIEKYGQYLGIDDAAIRAEQAALQQVEPELVATGGVSRSRFLFERYRAAAVYLMLTLLIVVPTVWFGVRSTLDRDLSHLTPLDASPVAQQDALDTHAGKSTTAVASAVEPVVAAPVAADQEQPLMASMAPFPSMGETPAPAPKAVVTETGTGGHSLSLNLDAASWVEITEQDGTRLEYGILPAGSSKTWHSDQPLDVRIGNANGAQASIDGQPVTLDDYRHANVAHFRVQIADGKADAANL